MREILFRGKRTDNNEWIKGSYMKHINRTPCVIDDSVKDEDIEHIILFDEFSDWNMPRGIRYTHVDPSTVGQYAGLRDKNGKQIFEGDILRQKRNGVYGLPFTVVFEDGAFMWNDHDRTDFLYQSICDTCEVIGNIYDNSELIGDE